MRYLSTILLVWICLTTLQLNAQSNDECDTAILLNDVTDWCSATAAYSNQNATASGYGPANCFTSQDNDVWFRFVAVATDVTIVVRGNTADAPGGSLVRPEVALYSGSCGGTINQHACSANNASNIVELYKGGLIPGVTYYIRIKGRASNKGTFQLCIKSYNTPAPPGSDCATASLLCDKSPFSIQAVSGAGNNNNEAPGTCLANGGPSESNSSWFVWTAKTSGRLTFTLSPTNVADDLDFVVFELPNGVANCADKRALLCMAAGDFSYPSPCMGPTGLREGSTDTSEPAGCGGGNDSWLRPLDMVAGKSYALLVNNYTSTGNGFSISFGGTGEFLGPEPDFELPNTTVCVGDPLSITDTSTDPTSSIIGWYWSFGLDASIASANTQQPPQVSYSSPGVKSIVLTIENQLGCKLTLIKNINISACCDTKGQMNIAPSIANVECAEDTDGQISLNVNSPYPPVQYLWENGATGSTLSGISKGDYAVTISDLYCENERTYTVNGPAPIEVDTLMKLATCAGGQDGEFELLVTGGVAPYLFNWNDGLGFRPENKRTGLAIGPYSVTVQDANNCQVPLDLVMRELVLELDPTVQTVTPPTCYGYANGSIVLVIDNGRPPFQYDWNDGQGYQGENSIFNIASGNFIIDVLDANLCRGRFNLSVVPPPLLEVALDSVPVSCFGEQDGEAHAMATGGTGDYHYIWDDPSSQNSPYALDLAAGTYHITVTDDNGCLAYDSIEVTHPNELFIDNILTTPTICYGYADGSLLAVASGGNPPYLYSLNGTNFQEAPLFDGIKAGTYTVYIKDTLGCVAQRQAMVDQPEKLVVDIEKDTLVTLGQQVQLFTTVYPTGWPVTYLWSQGASLDCVDCPNPIVLPLNGSYYAVTITDEAGCWARDSVRVRVRKDYPIFVPNVFTPNADGNNDAFTIFGGPAVRNVRSLRVFNRWGALVYEGKDLPLNSPTDGWDGIWNGKPMPPDVYAYYLEVEYIDSEVVLFKGDVTLVR